VTDSWRPQDIWARRKCPLHQNPEEKGWVPSRPEDFLATDEERERCKEILMRSALGRWDELEMSKGCEDQLRSSCSKRPRPERYGLQTLQRWPIDGEREERSLEWE
jgi:hypothetical protein